MAVGSDIYAGAHPFLIGIRPLLSDEEALPPMDGQQHMSILALYDLLKSEIEKSNELLASVMNSDPLDPGLDAEQRQRATEERAESRGAALAPGLVGSVSGSANHGQEEGPAPPAPSGQGRGPASWGTQFPPGIVVTPAAAAAAAEIGPEANELAMAEANELAMAEANELAMDDELCSQVIALVNETAREEVAMWLERERAGSSPSWTESRAFPWPRSSGHGRDGWSSF